MLVKLQTFVIKGNDGRLIPLISLPKITKLVPSMPEFVHTSHKFFLILIPFNFVLFKIIPLIVRDFHSKLFVPLEVALFEVISNLVRVSYLNLFERSMYPSTSDVRLIAVVYVVVDTKTTNDDGTDKWGTFYLFLTILFAT